MASGGPEGHRDGRSSGALHAALEALAGDHQRTPTPARSADPAELAVRPVQRLTRVVERVARQRGDDALRRSFFGFPFRFFFAGLCVFGAFCFFAGLAFVRFALRAFFGGFLFFSSLSFAFFHGFVFFGGLLFFGRFLFLFVLGLCVSLLRLGAD